MSSVQVGSATASPSPPGARHSQHHGVIMAACLFSVFALLLLLSLCYVRRISRQNNSVAAADAAAAATATATASSASCQREGRLEPESLASLPVFVYSLSTVGRQEKALDCAVCLAEFREGEKGRKLPRCGHSFHAECIDMWLESHSNCPLCRVTVEPESTDSAV